VTNIQNIVTLCTPERKKPPKGLVLAGSGQ